MRQWATILCPPSHPKTGYKSKEWMTNIIKEICLNTCTPCWSSMGSFQIGDEQNCFCAAKKNIFPHVLLPRPQQIHIHWHLHSLAPVVFIMATYSHFFSRKGKSLKQQRWVYFKNKWNLLELSIILLSWSALAVFIVKTLLGNRDMTYYQKNKDQWDHHTLCSALNWTYQYVVGLKNGYNFAPTFDN